MIVFLDNNRLQVSGYVRDICNLAPLEDKWRSFGWHVRRIDGHDLRQIAGATEIALSTPGAPHMIVADTTKGKGVSYMEDRWEWHSKELSEEDYRVALADLDRIEKTLVREEAHS